MNDSSAVVTTKEMNEGANNSHPHLEIDNNSSPKQSTLIPMEIYRMEAAAYPVDEEEDTPRGL